MTRGRSADRTLYCGRRYRDPVFGPSLQDCPSIQDSQLITLRQETQLNAQPKVLLVEDEALVAALAVDALEELGYQTVEAATSKAALAICAGSERLAFAIIDVGL